MQIKKIYLQGGARLEKGWCKMTILLRGKKISCILCTVFFLVLTSQAYALEYIAEGTGPTRKAAIQDSFRNALENVSGMTIDSSTRVTNSRVMHDQIYTHANGFIRSYQVLQTLNDGEQYKVKTKVVIDMEPNAKRMSDLDKVKAIHVGINDPRIGIIILNQNNAMKASDVAVQTAIASVLSQSGFSHIITMNRLNQLKSRRFKTAAAKSDFTAIGLLGTQEQLDYIVTGSIHANDIDIKFNTQMPMKAADATLTINMTKCDTGETIQSGTYQATRIDITKKTAADNAKYTTGENAGHDIANKLLTYAASASKNYTIYVHNIKDQNSLSLLKDYLTDISGVQDVYIREFSNDHNTAVIDLSFAGDNQTLASYITEDTEQSAQITKITNSTLDLTMQK